MTDSMRAAMQQAIIAEFSDDAQRWGWEPDHAQNVFWVAADHAAREARETIQREAQK